jgi:hypothetical protein
MKYKQRKDKIHKTHTLAGRNESNIKNRIHPTLSNSKNQVFNYIHTLYEGEWEVFDPIFPTWEWILESFNSMDDNPSRREQGSSDTADSSFTDAVTFDEAWSIYMWAEGSHNFVWNMPLTWDYGYEVLNGGEIWDKTYYRCINADWEGWSDELVDGKCPTDGANVIASTFKYFSCDGDVLHNFATWSGDPVWMRTTTGMNFVQAFNDPAYTNTHLQIDRLNFTASGTYTGDPALIGGALRIIVNIYTGSETKYMIYQYNQWSVQDDARLVGDATVMARYFDSPRITLNANDLLNFDRNLYTDYKTLFGALDEDTWRTYRIKNLEITPDTYSLANTNGQVNPYVQGEFTFDMDNIRLIGTDETLIKFPYTLESSQLELGDGMLPFIHTTVLTKITDSVNIDEFLPISPHYNPFQRLELLRKVGSSKEESINYYILEKQSYILIDLEYPWTDLEYPQFKLKINYIPDQVAIENIKEELI